MSDSVSGAGHVSTVLRRMTSKTAPNLDKGKFIICLWADNKL